VATAGCGQVNALKARKAFKDANGPLSESGLQGRPLSGYEEVVSLDPSVGDAYFYLANSYDNQFRATKKGDAANDAMLTKAIENYKRRRSRPPTRRSRSSRSSIWSRPTVPTS
jgi:hypothetical protein